MMTSFTPITGLILFVLVCAAHAATSYMGKPSFDLLSLGRAGSVQPKKGAGLSSSSPPAYYFSGNSNCYFRVTSNGKYNLKSITIFTFIKQAQLQDGAIVEWPGINGKPYGTHFWIWGKTLFVNLMHNKGQALGVHYIAVPTNKWNFVGMSYDHTTGVLLMWVNDKLLVKNVGKFTLDTVGDVYIGVRPKDHKYHPLKAWLSGVTLLSHAISQSQYVNFRSDVYRLIFNIPPPASYFLGKPSFGLLSLGRAGSVQPKTGAGPSNSSPAAYYFPGKPDCYVRVTSNGKYNLKSITIFTFIKQAQLRDGAIVEWPGINGKPYGTHFWIWGKTLFVNLMHNKGQALGVHYIAVPTNKWNFVGMSYDHTTGVLLMWVNDKLLVKNVGKFTLDTVGDVYIGVRPKDHKYHPLQGWLSGVTLLPHAISQSQYTKFRSDVYRLIFKLPPPATYFLGKPSFDLISLGSAVGAPKKGAGPSSSSPAAYYFPGNSNCYVRVTSNGKYNFKSMTIFTFITQTQLRNGPIVEWPGINGKPFGTHFWIWGNTLFVNLMHNKGRALGVHYIAVPAKRWNFVGMSYDHTTGVLLMWVNEKLLVKNVGKFTLDTVGDVYVGVRPKDRKFHPLQGWLSGLTLLSHAISQSQYAKFRSDVYRLIFKLPAP